MFRREAPRPWTTSTRDHRGGGARPGHLPLRGYGSVWVGSLSCVSSSPYAQWLCPSQFAGVLVVDLAAGSGPIDRCCCCCTLFGGAVGLWWMHIRPLGVRPEDRAAPPDKIGLPLGIQASCRVRQNNITRQSEIRATLPITNSCKCSKFGINGLGLHFANFRMKCSKRGLSLSPSKFPRSTRRPCSKMMNVAFTSSMAVPWSGVSSGTYACVPLFKIGFR